MPKNQNKKIPEDDKKKIADIQTVLKQIEKHRSSHALLYVTGGIEFGTQISLESLFIIRDLLDDAIKKSKENDKVTLLLRTLGGSTNAPWPIINLIREYCKEFEIIVIDQAMSAGTLICLGADNIVMTPTSFLGPVDPTRTVEMDDGNVKRFAVEDIMHYFDFGKERLGISKEGMVELVKELNQEILPTQLGSIYRTHELIKNLSEKSLLSHQKEVPLERREKIVQQLTSKLYAHDHLINRNEAKNTIGFYDIIEYADEEIKSLVNSLSGYMYSLLHFNNIDQTSLTPQDINNKDNTVNSGILFSSSQGSLYQYTLTRHDDQRVDQRAEWVKI